ncbi:GNAT family N-acetyltransferase [Ovoidimarina sediminis]|uniref:GNAT family N-acetyltransferase n=1 Tax=Ovoidimarina sediminis TaxID=3079856 RepID=UPI002909B8BF|nr:GNAT family protein [Rhodophyticola sp. MJ-SS7]MDU8944960.1 GNAT family protein [Rhodophyticola sp. MJ-SS7]
MKIDLIVNQATIETERFALRPVRRSDAGLLSMYASDARIATMTRSIPHPLPPGATEAFIERAMSEDRAEDVWIIDGSSAGHGEVLGTVGLKKMDRAQSEIGYWIAPAFWNTGLASEAVRALIDANPNGDDAYFASVFQDNPASARVLTNAGFEYIGDAETFSVARGANLPTWTYILKLS